ncbi:hypothetical protein DdX_18985 [Ditylenchus destructor]|uniref:Uncharacterized protein n=1 Tax=Ditylenchus destructor TaxID=166010 RepID=A0AAD4MIN6_9BILA|nr:hypothetical protein DdX_18985 [Ditylenchus destructor]
MRRNITEKYYKNITQGGQTSSTLRITTDRSEPVTETSPSTITSIFAPIILDQHDIEEGLSQIADIRNITEEMMNNVLSTLDTFLISTQHVLQVNSSRILQSLSSIVRNSCCDIDFIGDLSLVVRRNTVSCLETDPKQWPTMNGIPIKLNFGYHEPIIKNHVSIEIPYETVCNEPKNNEYIVIYYLFSNQMLFAEKEKTGPDNVCELRKRPQQNVPVLSAQLVDKLSMETIHKMIIDEEHREMARIVFPVPLSGKLHGSTKLVYWEGEKWLDVKNSKTIMEHDHNVYVTNHLTDFTLVVDGLEMDPMLCDVALDSISVMINFLSFAGLLTLIGHFSIKRCWIRPDYVLPAVVLPLGFLSLNSAFIFFLIFIRIASQGGFLGIYVTFGQSSVRTTISTGTDSTKSVRSDNSSASLVSNGAKYVEKAFTLLCIQLMLGIPWICQYLALFAPQLTAAHYVFTVVIGSQGLIFFMLFCYRKIKSRYS